MNFGGLGATYSNFGSLYFGSSGLEASRVEINLTALGWECSISALVKLYSGFSRPKCS